MVYSISEHKTLKSIALLQKDWSLLYDEVGTSIFQSWQWNWSWILENFKENENFVVTLHNDSKLSCVFPLSITSRNYRKVISVLSSSEMADYPDLLCCNYSHDNLLVVMIKYLQTKYRAKVRLKHILNNSQTYLYLQKALGENQLLIRRQFIVDSPFVQLNQTFEQYYESRAKKIKSEIRYTEKRLCKQGELSFEVATSVKERKLYFNRLVFLHQQRQVKKVGHSIFSSKKSMEFFLRLISDSAGETYECHLSSIKLNGSIASVVFGLVSKNTFYYWIPVIDPQIKGVSLGKLHIKNLIAESYDSGLKKFDFMGGDERYKYKWAENMAELYNFEVYQSKLVYTLSRLLIQTRQLLVKLKNKYSFLQSFWIACSKFKRSR